MKKTSTVFFLLLLAAACSSGKVKLTKEAEAVKLSNTVSSNSCRTVGEVSASRHDKGDHLEEMVVNLRKELRNQAAKLGANHVVIETNNDSIFANMTVVAMTGTAYRCQGVDMAQVSTPTKEGLANDEKKEN